MSLYYAYHPQYEAKLVTEDEYYKLLEDGWFKTPADFPTTEKKLITTEGLGSKEEPVVIEEKAPKKLKEVKETKQKVAA